MEGGVWPEVGNNQVPQNSPFPSILLTTSLGYLQPLGNSRGQDWVTYELNQHLLLSPRAPAVPRIFCPAAFASCPLIPLYIHLFLLFNFYFFLLLNDVVYGKKLKSDLVLKIK
jgi:hypothetical protein